MASPTRIEFPIERVVGPSADSVHGGLPLELFRFTVTVAHGDLAAAAAKILIPALVGGAWQILDAFIDGTGTAFSGGGGDRLMRIQDSSGTKILTTIPAASLGTLVSARLGSTAMPIPDSQCPVTLTAGEAAVAVYSGGSADYSAGSVPITLLAARVS